ncbi:MAG: YlbF family regulator [Anaerolineae bacterium]|nr:YlbF family regulator [Anaerolineae bacterium]
MEAIHTIDVRQALVDYANALTETPEYQHYEETSKALRNSPEAQQVIALFQQKQRSLQFAIMLNTLNEDDRSELLRLQNALMTHPAIAAYLEAQATFSRICQESAAIISEHLGLPFAVRSGSCCG